MGRYSIFLATGLLVVMVLFSGRSWAEWQTLAIQDEPAGSSRGRPAAMELTLRRAAG
jgi:hypothetical protein